MRIALAHSIFNRVDACTGYVFAGHKHILALHHSFLIMIMIMSMHT